MPTVPLSPTSVSRSFYEAWTGGDIDAALGLLAERVVVDAPRAGRLVGAEQYGPVLREYLQVLTGSELLAIAGDERSSLVYYNNFTNLVDVAPTVEYHTVQDGKITYIRIIFDRLPFENARHEAGLPNSLQKG